MENPKINTGKWRIPSQTRANENGPPCKIRGKTYILGGRSEVDRDLVLHCKLGVVELFRNGLGKHWVQFSLASDLIRAIQLD